MDKQTADKNERVVVRILDNGNARTVNPYGSQPMKWNIKISESSMVFNLEWKQWQQAESACVELPVKIESYDRIPVRNVNNLKSGIEFYAYRDNDHFVLIEPKTE